MEIVQYVDFLASRKVDVAEEMNSHFDLCLFSKKTLYSKLSPRNEKYFMLATLFFFVKMLAT